MSVANLSQRFISTLRPKPGARENYFDIGRGAQPGLVLRVGSRRLVYYALGRLAGRPAWVRVGDARKLAVDEARRAAKVYIGQMAAGIDPNAKSRRSKAARRGRRAAVARSRSTLSVLKLVTLYVGARERKLATKTLKNYSETMRAELLGTDLGQMKAARVVRADLRSHLGTVAKRAPYVADQVLALLRAAYRWGNVEEAAPGRALVDRDPTRGLEPFAPRTKRTQFLSDELIPTFWHGVVKLDLDRASYARLLLLLGLRRGEAHRAQFKHVDLKAATWRIPVEHRKVRVSVRDEVGDLLMPLPPLALRILRELQHAHPLRDRIFRFSVGNIGTDIQQAAGLPWLKPHDLRRSCARGLERIGAPPHVISLALGHTGKLPGQVASDLHYTAQQRPAEVRSWLERWAEHVERLTKAG